MSKIVPLPVNHTLIQTEYEVRTRLRDEHARENMSIGTIIQEFRNSTLPRTARSAARLLEENEQTLILWTLENRLRMFTA